MRGKTPVWGRMIMVSGEKKASRASTSHRYRQENRCSWNLRLVWYSRFLCTAPHITT